MINVFRFISLYGDRTNHPIKFHVVSAFVNPNNLADPVIDRLVNFFNERTLVRLYVYRRLKIFRLRFFRSENVSTGRSIRGHSVIALLRRVIVERLGAV